MDDPTRREFTAELVSIAAAPALRFPVAPRKGWEPAYLRLERSGELERRATELQRIYRSCRLCPRQCGVDRVAGEKGVCRSAARAKVNSVHPHFGEEAPLVGRWGSGTVFFSDCNLRCVFCQNWQISHRGDGTPVSDETLARLMIDVESLGCHNINLVTPTHVAPSIVSALRVAIRRGLRAPLVYNCGGYESLEVVKLLDGIVDIYLPDYKYTDGAMAEKFSAGAADYPEAAAAAIEEMHRQVGNLVVDERGIALRGLIIRHLVLPNNVSGTDRFLRWVGQRLGPETYVNLMGQYRPEYQANRYPELNRRVSRQEYAQAVEWARAAGLRKVEIQGL